MLNLKKDIFNRRNIYIIVLLLGFCQFSYSSKLFPQGLSGPDSVEPSTVETYHFDDGFVHFFINWTVTGGAIISSGLVSGTTTHYVIVQWGAAGSGNVTCDQTVFGTYTLLGSLNVSIAPLPAIPDLPLITNYCNSTRLTRGNPPSGEVWYWQDGALGKSTSDAAEFKDRDTGTVYYLSSYNPATLQWSAVRTINYTITSDDCESTNKNYIHTIAPRIATTNTSLLANDEKIETIMFYDGLGKSRQVLNRRAGGQEQDIIAHIEYDALGRQIKDYLPYAEAANTGAFRTNARVATEGFYNTAKYENTLNPYSQKLYEQSPLNRVLEQTAPGNDWEINKVDNHAIKFDYSINTATEVKFYKVDFINDDPENPLLVMDGTYGEAQLYKTITKDENWTSGTAHTTEEFKDKQGRVVLKRTYGASDMNNDKDTGDTGESNATHDTYYVYDDFGNLTYVLPPKVVHDSSISSTELDELCYQYVYDNRNRLVEKKIPGKGWEYIVYNKLDQPVLTQDANQTVPSTHQWLFTKYDSFGRVAYTGRFDSNSARTSLQNTVDGISTLWVTKQSSATTIAGTTIYYNNGAYPTTSIVEIYTINYYDNYTFDKSPLSNPPAIIDGQTVINYNNASSTQKLTKGLPTGSKVRVLGTNNWITSVFYYDVKGRPIYNASFNANLTTTDVVKSTLDFTGNTNKTVTTHSRTGYTTITTTDTFTYDPMSRLISQKNQIGSGNEELIVLNSYDELGQMEEKKVGGDAAATIENSTGLQTVDYTYNIRGWLKQINDPVTLGNKLFAFKLNYNTTEMGIPGVSALYNGNISETIWRTANTETYGNRKRGYAYKYDALNRIIEGQFRRANSAGSSFSEQTTNYNVTGIIYDQNGNIEALNRKGVVNTSNGFGDMDKLVYDYYPNTNQLRSVDENTGGSTTYGFKDGSTASIEYTYDANGNMWKDLNKGIGTSTTNGITYNHLNLPTEVKFNNSSTQKINYIYDATGVKLEKVVTEGSIVTRTKYAGNYVYQKIGSGTEALKFFNHPEGYVDTESGYDYVYQYKDHLGNIRLNYHDNNGNLEILEENNYYPFGLKHKGYNNAPLSNHPYKYNGKELNEELGLDWYDYGARNYDAALGRYFSVDRMSEAYYDLNPYQYAANNPVKFIDVNGDYIYIWDNGTQYRYENGEVQKQNEKGKWIKHSAQKDSYVAQIQSALGKISEGDPNSVGSQFLSLFENDDINVDLNQNTSTKKGIKDRNVTQGTNIYTSFNQNESIRTTGGSEKLTENFHITLGHELAHGLANNTIKQSALDAIWVSNIETEDGNRNIKRSEVFASMFENMLRASQGLELRTHYVGGSSDERSRLIKKSKTKNPFSKVYNPTEATLKIWNELVKNKKE